LKDVVEKGSIPIYFLRLNGLYCGYSREAKKKGSGEGGGRKGME